MSSKWEETTVYLSTSLVAPAVRMVVVDVWECRDGEFASEFIPVVALRSRVLRRFTRLRQWERTSLPPGTVKELLDAGWSSEHSPWTEDTALIVDPDFGLVGFNEHEFTATNVERRLVTCPWPEVEDELRLAEVVESLGHDLLERKRLRAAANAG